jgi:ABC-type antimicrobial peptide transport system permease subunit
LGRRKAKNVSAILAVTLGVTLLVGIQITTSTLENSFLTTMLQNEGEVDIRISNATAGGVLSISDASSIGALIPNAVGIMPELSTEMPVSVGSQFDPTVKAAGIKTNYSTAFGHFYDWSTGEEMRLDTLLTSNSTVIISSHLAENIGIDKQTPLPITLNTEFTNLTITFVNDTATGIPTAVPNYTTIRPELSITGIFDSKRPGIGAQYTGVIFSLDHMQQWLSLQSPTKQKDQVTTYLVALKTNHFKSEISKDYLKQQVDQLKEAIPIQNNNQTGNNNKIYTVSAPRLTFFSVAEFFITLLSSMLNALGFLVMITGVLLITNIQLMSVEDREFQTGVMRAVGENRRGIVQSMLFENMFQGVIGGLLGLFGGLGFGQLVAMYLVSLFGTGATSVQPVISQEIVILSVIIGIALSIVTGILPALRASRVNIVEALRGVKISFQEKASRNWIALGILALVGGAIVLSINGIIDTNTQTLLTVKGWDTLDEWQNILIGSGLVATGLGLTFSHFIDRVKALNITAIVLWAMPALLFIVAMDFWIKDITGLSIQILIIGIIEIVVGSVLFVALNLPIVMRGLRTFTIRIKGLRGVAQISPALISSHKSRSTLTFAIFAIILTLNVLVATLIPTNLGTVTQTEQDSRGIDIFVSLNKPEQIINQTSYSQQLYKIDPAITDVIGLRTYKPNTDYTKYTALADPTSPTFNPSTQLLPLKVCELTKDQIIGNATTASDPNWRYDYYLSGFPDGVRQPTNQDTTDQQLLDMSKESWELFFDQNYKMPAYNVSMNLLSFFSGDSNLQGMDITSALGGLGNDDLSGVATLKNQQGMTIENPIVFVDSFLLPLGSQIWLPMNSSTYGVSQYKAFTIAGKIDSQRAGGFPIDSYQMGQGEGDLYSALGRIYIPEQWSNQTAFFATTNGGTPRATTQYDHFLIKTQYAIDDKRLPPIAQEIEQFTNTNNEGYRGLAQDNFYVASATVLYSKVEASLQMVTRIISFLQIYVTFGLVIGALGMGIISVRNVSERKREIGMMRAIGFPKTQVMASVLLELVVLGVIGLAIGIVNGLVISIGFANMQNVALVIPWTDLGIYLSIITFIALIAGAIPGWLASRIPPAEALRYVG